MGQDIVLKIKGQRLSASYEPIYSGSIGVLRVVLCEEDFPEGLIKALRFRSICGAVSYVADIENGIAVVPGEVIKPPGFSVSVAGYDMDGESVLRFYPTQSAQVKVARSGFDDPKDEQGGAQSVFGHILDQLAKLGGLIEEAQSTIEAHRQSAEIDHVSGSVTEEKLSDELKATIKKKVDAVAGKGLSTNDYTNNDKGMLENAVARLESAEISLNEAERAIMLLQDELLLKQDEIVFDTVPKEGSQNPVTSGGIADALDDVSASVAGALGAISGDIENIKKYAEQLESEKQDRLTIEQSPKKGSANPISSGALAEVYEKLESKNQSQDEAIRQNTEKIESFTDEGGNIPPERLSYVMPKAEISGYPIKVSDSLSGTPALSIKVFGTSTSDEEHADLGDYDTASAKYKIPVVCRGKNLFDKANAAYLIGYFNKTYSSITAHANARIIYLPCKPNTTYTISRDTEYSQFHFGYTKELPAVGVSVYGINTASNANVKSLTITTGADAKYIVAYLYNGYSEEGAAGGWENIINGLQIEYGDTATEYEAYFEKSVMTACLDTPLSPREYIDLLAKKRYAAGGTSSDIEVDGGIVFNGSETNTIACDTWASPEKIELGYYRDINKVIENLTNAIIAMGGNT